MSGGYLAGIDLPLTAVVGGEPEWLAEQAAELGEDAIIVHLGIDRGASLICSRAGNPDAVIVGVDNDPRCLGLDLSAILVSGDSQLMSWDMGPIDFVFVDADHAEASVAADIRNWHGRLKPGGIVAFHDYGNDHMPWCKGVRPAVDAWDWSGWTELDVPGSIKAFRKDAG